MNSTLAGQLTVETEPVPAVTPTQSSTYEIASLAVSLSPHCHYICIRLTRHNDL